MRRATLEERRKVAETIRHIYRPYREQKDALAVDPNRTEPPAKASSVIQEFLWYSERCTSRSDTKMRDNEVRGTADDERAEITRRIREKQTRAIQNKSKNKENRDEERSIIGYSKWDIRTCQEDTEGAYSGRCCRRNSWTQSRDKVRTHKIPVLQTRSYMNSYLPRMHTHCHRSNTSVSNKLEGGLNPGWELSVRED